MTCITGGATDPAAARTVHGIDFSGGAQAGRKIWLASGRADADGFTITACRPAAALPGSGNTLAQCLPPLRAWIAGLGRCVVGCDFPFGLPAALLRPGDSWTDFLSDFTARYPNALALRQTLLDEAGGCEWRRRCDKESRTPFAAYNLRIYRQTYAGIAGLLQPLVESGSVRVAPMQVVLADRPVLIEVCPASTLKCVPAMVAPEHGGADLASLYRPYKGRGSELRCQRARILATLTADWNVTVAAELVPRILDDGEGDALDSVIAAFTAWQALQSPSGFARAGDDYAREGFVYIGVERALWRPATPAVVKSRRRAGA